MNPFTMNPVLRIRVLVNFFNRLLDSMITSFMAIYLAFSFGVAAAGVLIIVVVTIGALGMLGGGHISDTRGRRRTLLVAEFGIFATYTLMALGNSHWWGNALVVYAGYLLNKLAASVALPANDAMIVDVTTPETRKAAYTLIYWATNLALAVGSLLGAWLYNGHFTLMLTIASTCTAGIVVTTYLLIPETLPNAADAAPRTSRLKEFTAGYALVLRDSGFIRLMVAATLILGIELQIINYVAVRLNLHLPVQNLVEVGSFAVRVDGVRMLGILRAENTILVVALMLFAHVLFRRFSDRAVLYLGTAMFVGGYMVLAVSDIGWALLIAGLVFTVGELMSVPVRQTMLANMVPENSRTRYMAVYNLNLRLAQGIAALFITIGSVVPPWGIALLYAAMGLVIVQQYRVLLARPTARDELVTPVSAKA
ncbi:MFS transporter [Dactylosporangium sp. CA-092794]|uniref:MFS transporter n=1 Tax=Dactylosporangium sp. CA-092794 TaxID=3239929 RepID=UPI003D92794F